MVELLQALAPHFRAIAIDYPSHGHSDHIDWQPTIEDYARCVVEVMDALKIERAFAMGEAVGAATSIALGARWPQRIDKAVLINIPYFSDADTARNDIADIAKVRPSDELGLPRATLDKIPAGERSRACADAADAVVDGPHQHRPARDRPRPLAGDGRARQVRHVGRPGGAEAAGADALRRELHLRQASRADAIEVPARQARDRARRPLLHELGARDRHRRPRPAPSWPDHHEPRRDRPPERRAVALRPRRPLHAADAARADDAAQPTPRGPATVGQARGLHRSRLRRQQAAQARLRAARGAARGRRHAGLGRRGAVQQPAPGRGRGGEARARLPSRRLSRQAGTALGRVWPHGQCAAQPPVRRHPARRAVERRSQRRHPRPCRQAAGRGPQDLRRALRRLQSAGRGGLCLDRGRDRRAVRGAGVRSRRHRPLLGQRRHAGRPGRRRPRLPACDAHRRHRHRRRARARAGRRG